MSAGQERQHSGSRQQQECRWKCQTRKLRQERELHRFQLSQGQSFMDTSLAESSPAIHAAPCCNTETEMRRACFHQVFLNGSPTPARIRIVSFDHSELRSRLKVGSVNPLECWAMASKIL